MKRDVSVEAKKAQFMVEKAMDDITRGTRKVLMDYVSRMYVTSFAKAIAYLGLESEDANSLLNTMDADTRHQVEAFAKDYQKSDAQVISEVEHIVTSSGMDFTDNYKIIKDNIILSGKVFAEETVHKFQKETPIFQKKIEDCLFSFEDFQYLDDRAIQKVLRDTDMQELVLVPGDFDHSVTGEKSQKVTRENDQKSHLTPLIIQFPEDCQKQFLPFL